MASSSPRAFLLPFPAYGLMIPMIDLASLFTSRGIDTTIITTPGNASFFPSHLNLLLLPSSPFTAIGLPSGCENLADLPQPEHQHMLTFMHAMSLLREPLAALLAEHSPTCLVSDYRCPWTVDMGIPRIVFQPTGAFSAAVSDIIYTYEPHKKMENPMEQFLIPGGIPHPICMTRSELPGIFNLPREAFQITKESLCQCLGVIFHTFYELEPWYVDYLKASGPKKVWCAGVLPLYKKRAECTEAEWEPTKAWLDSKKPGSVIYLCFGSTSVLGEGQLKEIAAGLHASNHPFLWVVKGEWPARNWNEMEGLENKGRILTRWAPQVEILNHPSIGGFVTHCGWNSSLEAIAAGVPVAGWPLRAEQFLNERLLVEVMGVGVSMLGEGEARQTVRQRGIVGRERVREVVSELMGGGERAVEWRNRAAEYCKMAREAVKDGGSSDQDMAALIEEIHRMAVPRITI